MCEPSYVGVSGGIDGDAVAIVIGVPTEVGGIDEGRSKRVELRHEGVVAAVVGRVEGPGGSRKVRGISRSSHVGAPRGVDGDSEAVVIAAPPEVGGVDESRAKRVQLRHEGVVVAVSGRVEGPDGSRKIRGPGNPSNIGASGRIDGELV